MSNQLAGCSSDTHASQEQEVGREVQGDGNGMANAVPVQHGQGDAAEGPSGVSFLLIHGYNRWSFPVSIHPAPTVSQSHLYQPLKACASCPDRPRATEGGRYRGRSSTASEPSPSHLPIPPTPLCCHWKFEGQSKFSSAHQ